MLKFNPEDRPNAEEILNYDWFHSASSYKIISDDGALRRLSEF
jgi:serine/threonine protein kinase